MIVWEDDKTNKSEYGKFIVRTVNQRGRLCLNARGGDAPNTANAGVRTKEKGDEDLLLRFHRLFGVERIMLILWSWFERVSPYYSALPMAIQVT